MEDAHARPHLHVRTGKKDVVYYEVKCLPTASALPAPTDGDFGMSRPKRELLVNYTLFMEPCEGTGTPQESHTVHTCQRKVELVNRD
jgi:hypothetical protein